MLHAVTKKIDRQIALTDNLLSKFVLVQKLLIGSWYKLIQAKIEKNHAQDISLLDGFAIKSK